MPALTLLFPATVPIPPVKPHSATLSIELLLGRQELVVLHSRLSINITLLHKRERGTRNFFSLFSVNLIYSTVLNIFHVHFISYFMWKNSHNPWWEKQSTCQILFDISKEMEFQPCKWRVDVVRIVNQTIDAFSWVRFARTADAGCVPSF